MNGRGLRRLARLGVFGLPCVGLACADTSGYQRPVLPTPYGAVAPASVPASAPAGDSAFQVRLASQSTTPEPSQRPTVAVGVDTILRLVEEQNPQIAVARSRVCAAFAEKELADTRWLPDIYVGLGYWRHEGGIQLQEGPLIRSSTGAFLTGAQVNASFSPRDVAFRQLNAARKIWQDHGDLTKITTEQLLEASTTYVDLLAAYSALAIAQDLEKKLRPLHEQVTQALKAEDNRIWKTEQLRLDAELQTQRQGQQKLQTQIDAAAAKLAYLLGLDPNSQIVPIDPQIAGFQIVDATTALDQLVAQAVANGPGIRELEGILCVIQQGLDQARGTGRFAPIFDLQAGEGLFGAGPGATTDWANRFDIGLQARWSINDLCLADKKRQLAFSQINQAHLTYQELRAKLTLGVQEARATSLNNQSQLAGAEELIKKAKAVVDHTEKIFAAVGPKDAKYTDVMQAHKGVALAQLNYVDLMREFDKAQLRLMILLGPGAHPAGPAPERLPNPVIPRQ